MSAPGQRQTFAGPNRMSALPPEADIRVKHCHVCFGPEGDIGLFDDLVGEQLHRTRHLDAECLRGFHVDDQLELARPHHWEIAGLFTLENAADEDAGLPIRGETIGAITDEPAGQSEGSPFLNRGHRIAFGQGNDLFAAVVKHHIGGYDEPACARLDQSRKGRVDLSFACSLEDVQRQPNPTGRLLDLRYLRLGSRPGRIDENRDGFCRGSQLAQDSHPLCRKLGADVCDARDIAARMVEALNQAQLHGVGPVFEDYRYRGGRRLCCQCDGRVTTGRYHGHRAANEVCDQRGQPIKVVFYPAIFDRDVSAFDIAGLTEALTEGACLLRIVFCRSAVKPSDHGRARLLGARPERQGGRGSDKREDVPPPHAFPPKADHDTVPV